MQLNLCTKILYDIPDVDECASNPCQNGGACNDDVNGYTCSCEPGYEGIECEISRYHYLYHCE